MKISITMPVYNGEKFLKETLESIRIQTYQDWECICVDDGSSDGSLGILREYEQKDARFKVYAKENGRWASRAVKYALSLATGEYWRYASQDDIFSQDLLEKDIKRIEETNADICFPIMIWYDGKDKTVESYNRVGGYWGYKGDLKAEISGEEAFLGSIGYTSIHGFALFRMSLITNFGYYDYGFNADSYTTRVLLINSKKVVFSDGVFYYRQNNPNAITKAFSPIRFGMIETNARLRQLALDKNVYQAMPLINKQSLRDLINLKIMLLEHVKNVSIEENAQYKKLILQEWKLIFKNDTSITVINLLFLKNFNLFRLFCHLLLYKRKFLKHRIA